MLLLMSPCGVACEFLFCISFFELILEEKEQYSFFPKWFYFVLFFFLVAGFAPTHTHTEICGNVDLLMQG